ncbi:MAG: serine/threonine protein kinase [Zoogloeaceae bacterium]|jgi:serine/threonine protein kinase|nr:serine/threonine protein kinase [Zoogloeaceae bacterium]
MEPQGNAALPNGFELEGYTIDRQLSLGGFSVVYLAHDKLFREVVIKEYLPNKLALRGPGAIVPTVGEEHLGLFRHGMKSFFEEGRALSRLNHPNVVRVTNFFRANETVYLVMEYMRGCTLQTFIRKYQNYVTEHFIRNVFIRLLNGLRVVHSQRLLHLDIKPSNIYLRADKKPVLIDFGSVRQALISSEAMLSPMYTPGFASPEHYGTRKSIGPWSDIYSVGATLYTCLSGVSPQPADERQKHDQIIPASVRWEGEFSEQLLSTIDHCLCLDYLERVQSAFALQKALAEGAEKRESGAGKSSGSWLKRLVHKFNPIIVDRTLS